MVPPFRLTRPCELGKNRLNLCCPFSEGSLTVALVSVFAGMPEQISVLGVIVSSVFGLQLAYLEYALERDRHQATLLGALGLRRELVVHPEFLSIYHRIALSLGTLASSENATLQFQALSRLIELDSKISEMADGKLVFERTETWRTVYEQLLRKPEVKQYRSVAWFRTAEYWQDTPGKQSLELNCELAKDGLLIHRTVIVPESLWTADSNLPGPPVSEWIEHQHVHGILVRLVRESDIRDEPDLLVDFGLYGDVAVGFQIVDKNGRTSRFEIDYRASERQAAQRIWERLNLFATSYPDLLDREQKLP